MNEPSRRRHILHCVYGFDMGGLENIIVQLINRLPVDEFDHTVLSLTTIGECRARVTRPDTTFIALGKPPGHAMRLYPRILALLRKIRPDVVHTCNMATLEIVPLVGLAGIRRCVHAEHGWDMNDRDGGNGRYRFLRRLYRRFTDHQVAVSVNIRDYLREQVKVPPEKLSLIGNGVDLDVFVPKRVTSPVPGCPFEPGRHYLIGTVGRLAPIKNQVFLVRAFARAVKSGAPGAQDLRLLIVGEGRARADIEALLRQEGVADRAWLPGNRSDVAAILHRLDCFVLPSYSEGTSVAIQEAMASGLPVIATAVGGTPNLVEEGVTGFLVHPDDDETLAARLLACVDREMTLAMGRRARNRAERDFDIAHTIERYRELFA